MSRRREKHFVAFDFPTHCGSNLVQFGHCTPSPLGVRSICISAALELLVLATVPAIAGTFRFQHLGGGRGLAINGGTAQNSVPSRLCVSQSIPLTRRDCCTTVGCTSFSKPSEIQHLGNAHAVTCSTSVSHDGSSSHGLNDCRDGESSAIRCDTTVYHKRLRGIWRRGGVYQFRVRVPADLVVAIGKTHINRTLRTASYPDALGRCHLMALEFAEAFENARMGVAPSIPPPAQAASPSSALKPPHVTGGITLLEAWNRYLSDPSSARTHKTTLAYETVRNIVVSILGEDCLVSDLGRQDCRRVMETLQHLPSNYGKRWPAMKPESIAAMAQRKKLRPMSAANCNGYMSRWSGMMNWLVKEELAARNPCIGLRVADPVPVREKRRPFSTGQLQKIFSGDPFKGLDEVCQGRRLATPPSNFYVPLIALFSGLRQNEICQQTVDDIVELDGIYCFVVQPTPHSASE
ncbi:DUF6538 domain-containing protein [Blastomonas sp.]|uniref:DUF6538 domain-containing protein n=1 Tax=Blastomonas sp. TaxID=1909299 RepID=UPI003593D0EF